MELSKRQLRMYLLTVSRGADRSPLFWWMVEHYADTANAAQGRRMPWAALCDQFAVFGLTDGHGNPPSSEAARRTWRLVRTEMAKVQATPQPVASMPSRRMPPGWRPPVVEPKPANPPRRPAGDWLPRDGPPATGQPADSDQGKHLHGSDDPVEQRLASLRRTFAERSGH